MIAGRGLAHTGGRDRSDLSARLRCQFDSRLEASKMVHTIGCMIGGQTGEIAPADKRMYAIGMSWPHASTPLITGSILSKKAAEGLAALVMDIKVGRAPSCKH